MSTAEECLERGTGSQPVLDAVAVRKSNKGNSLHEEVSNIGETDLDVGRVDALTNEQAHRCSLSRHRPDLAWSLDRNSSALHQ